MNLHTSLAAFIGITAFFLLSSYACAQWVGSPRVHRAISNGDLVASDSAGGFFTAGGYEERIVERRNSEGRLLWSAKVQAGRVEALAADGAGGVYVLLGSGSGFTLYYALHHINADGNFAWHPDSARFICDEFYIRPRIAADMLGGCWVVTNRTEPPTPVIVRRFGPDGRPLWEHAPDGIKVVDTSGWHDVTALMPRPNGDLWLAWFDGRTSNTPSYRGIYAQCVDADGAERFQHNGVEVCGEPAARGSVLLAPGPMGGTHVVWGEAEEDDTPTIRMQHILAGGARLFGTTHGHVIATDTTRRAYAFEAISVEPDDRGGFYLAWPTDDSAVWLYHADVVGDHAWSPVRREIPVATIDRRGGPVVRLVSDGAGGVLVLWSGWHASTPQGMLGTWMHGTRVNYKGDFLWPQSGIDIVLYDSTDEWYPAEYRLWNVITDMQGGAFMTWSSRGTRNSSRLQAFCHRIFSTGGLGSISGVEHGAGNAGSHLQVLSGVLPSEMVIEYRAGRGGTVAFSVYDLMGRRVADLGRRDVTGGLHRATLSPAAFGIVPGNYLCLARDEHGNVLLRLFSVVR